jgi:thiol-disulfide isomerase/thioredoxin
MKLRVSPMPAVHRFGETTRHLDVKRKGMGRPVTLRHTVAFALLLATLGCGREPVAASRTAVATVTAQEIRSMVLAGTNGVTLLHFWATWCPPCVQEFPDIVALARRYQGRGLRVLLVSADAENDRDKVLAFLAAHQADWQSYQASNVNDDFIKSVSTNWSGALPASFLYAPDGTLADWWEGSRPYATHEQAVLGLLRRQPKGE